jgi:hypothetical protein
MQFLNTWSLARGEGRFNFCIILYVVQQYVHINLQLVKWIRPRLDRLTALLEGLSPKVTRTTKADGFPCIVRALLGWLFARPVFAGLP